MLTHWGFFIGPLKAMREPNGPKQSNCAGIELARGEHQDGWWNDISCQGGADAYPVVSCSIIETHQYIQCSYLLTQLVSVVLPAQP